MTTPHRQNVRVLLELRSKWGALPPRPPAPMGTPHRQNVRVISGVSPPSGGHSPPTPPLPAYLYLLLSGSIKHRGRIIPAASRRDAPRRSRRPEGEDRRGRRGRSPAPGPRSTLLRDRGT